MSENLFDDPQLKAIIKVMQDITENKVPFYEPHELAARSTLRAIQWQIDDHNVLDDGELIDVLNQARIEVKYLCSIITDLKQRIANRDSEIKALEYLNKFQASEISRIEKLAVLNLCAIGQHAWMLTKDKTTLKTKISLSINVQKPLQWVCLVNWLVLATLMLS
jgi:hypothetical protein